MNTAKILGILLAALITWATTVVASSFLAKNGHGMIGLAILLGGFGTIFASIRLVGIEVMNDMKQVNEKEEG